MPRSPPPFPAYAVTRHDHSPGRRHRRGDRDVHRRVAHPTATETEPPGSPHHGATRTHHDQAGTRAHHGQGGTRAHHGQGGGPGSPRPARPVLAARGRSLRLDRRVRNRRIRDRRVPPRPGPPYPGPSYPGPPCPGPPRPGPSYPGPPRPGPRVRPLRRHPRPARPVRHGGGTRRSPTTRPARDRPRPAAGQSLLAGVFSLVYSQCHGSNGLLYAHEGWNHSYRREFACSQLNCADPWFCTPPHRSTAVP
jgi:hypothetical protein